MSLRLTGAVSALALMVFALSPSAVRADSIDGEWCSKEGKHLLIRGSKITTPGGTEMTGLYDRHAFSYTVPAHEPDPGTTVFMTLVNEQTVRVTAGSEAGKPPETWLRCEVTS